MIFSGPFQPHPFCDEQLHKAGEFAQLCDMVNLKLNIENSANELIERNEYSIYNAALSMQ